MNLRPAGAEDAADLAAIHAAAFDTPWTEADMAGLLASPGVFAVLAADAAPRGMVLARAIAGEAEILTIGVSPDARRGGLGRALVEAALGVARRSGAETAFLEVAVDNLAAIALYQGAGFEPVGQRKGYYDRGAGGRADALVLRRDLNSI